MYPPLLTSCTYVNISLIVVQICKFASDEDVFLSRAGVLRTPEILWTQLVSSNFICRYILGNEQYFCAFLPSQRTHIYTLWMLLKNIFTLIRYHWLYQLTTGSFLWLWLHLDWTKKWWPNLLLVPLWSLPKSVLDKFQSKTLQLK